MIPSARFGDVKIMEANDTRITVKLYSLYTGGVKEVAANEPFCLWVITQAFEDLQTATWMSQDAGEVSKAKALLSQLGKEESDILMKYKTYVSSGLTTVEGIEDFKNLLSAIQVSEKEQCSFDTKKKVEKLEMERYLQYGYPKELMVPHAYLEEMTTEVQLVSVSIPVTPEGFSEYLTNPKTGFEKKMYRLGFIVRPNNPNKLETYIITPVLGKQLEDVLKYVDGDGTFQVSVPRDESAFIKAAKTEIKELTIGNIVKGATPYEEEAEMIFTVKNPEITKHIEVGRGLSF